MRSIRHIALGAFLTLGIFCAIFYTSCSKDSCGAVTCLNKGTCGGGICSCIKGIGGANCETVYRNIYSNTYKGNAPGNTGYTDSNNTLVFTADADTANFNTMHIAWNDTNVLVVSLPITLGNNSSTGSTFTVTSTVVGDRTYTGSGIVNSNVASLSLTETHLNGTVVNLQFNNFPRQ